MDSSTSPGDRLRVYVHLAYGFDANVWQKRLETGALLGLNESSPYGYHHARDLGADVHFSVDHAETKIGWLLRGATRLVLGFDLVHAYRNRKALETADVVWTHTESQTLAVLAILRLFVSNKPKVIGQTVWLIDSWSKLDPVRKNFYSMLLRRADVLTFLSPVNKECAQNLFPNTRCEFVQFGIRAAIQSPPVLSKAKPPFKILAVGNDRHRDWATLVNAFGGRDEFVVHVLSRTFPDALAKHNNVQVLRAKTNDQVRSAYLWSDTVVLPLKQNMHASGITVLEEAALFGKPTICTRAGGIDAYFRDDEVIFVDVGDPEAMRSAVVNLLETPGQAFELAARAQARMSAEDISSNSYVRRQLELSKEVLALPGLD